MEIRSPAVGSTFAAGEFVMEIKKLCNCAGSHPELDRIAELRGRPVTPFLQRDKGRNNALGLRQWLQR